jgi:hypothetical protein
MHPSPPAAEAMAHHPVARERHARTLPHRLMRAAGMILLEVSVVVFLLQGYLATGMQVSCPSAGAQLSS